MSKDIAALRSLLFAPGNHARRVEKALSLDADAVILDLEDAVALAEKAATRGAVAGALERERHGLLYVRVNAIDTEFCYGDLVAVVQPGLDGIILPGIRRDWENPGGREFLKTKGPRDTPIFIG
nr:(3S)-malyl-CoA thioesterase [uncultured bacterium]